MLSVQTRRMGYKTEMDSPGYVGLRQCGVSDRATREKPLFRNEPARRR